MGLETLPVGLAKCTYAVIERELEPLCAHDLVTLLDSRSTKIGETVANLLWARGKLDLLADAIINRALRRRIGKIRATSILLRAGKGFPRAEVVYLAVLRDRAPGVVDNALFGLVFLQNLKNVPAIKDARDKAPTGSEIQRYCNQALVALAHQDPFFFSPHFRDTKNVWGLDKSRFGTRTGF